ncbi:phage tail tube protein [Silvimonas soli]|uniref:phage tail tube protein n=1 Tax=Silvimonas soli TaxID=2980100 RepID=UPI0024B3AD1F|nr:phage tail tube protein [Silvimonas soli]
MAVPDEDIESNESTALDSQGTSVEFALPGSNIFTLLGEVQTVSAFDGQAAEYDVTHLKSKAKEKRMGLQDWGSASIDLNVSGSDAGQKAVRGAKRDRTRLTWRFTYVDGSSDTFTAQVRKFSKEFGVDSVVKGKLELLINGDVTEKEAAAADD